MLVSRDGASEKWCPMARFVGAENTGASCQAAACMMWRWFDAPGRTAKEELARRGYCGLAGMMRPRDAALCEAVAPEPVEMRHEEGDFNSRAGYILALRLANAGIAPHLLRGDIAVEDEPIGLVAAAADAGRRDDGAYVQAMAIEARLVDHRRQGLVPLTAAYFGVGATVESALMQAADQWIEACLPALRRAVDETNTARADGFVTHAIEGRKERQLFQIFNGPILASGRLEPNLPAVFGDNPHIWLADKADIVMPEGSLHLVKMSADYDPVNGMRCDCRLNGESLEPANQAMTSFKWPLLYSSHWLRWHTVLKAVD